jgi:hypothetical protein
VLVDGLVDGGGCVPDLHRPLPRADRRDDRRHRLLAQILRLVEKDQVEREAASGPRRRARAEHHPAAVLEVDRLSAVREDDARQLRFELRRGAHEIGEVPEHLPSRVDPVRGVEHLLAPVEPEQDAREQCRRLQVLPRDDDRHLVSGPLAAGGLPAAVMQDHPLLLVQL